MKKTKKRLSEYWDSTILRMIPPSATFNRFEGEIKEHFNFLGTMIKRILLPLIVFYIALGLIMGLNIFGSLFTSLIIFVYSNFLPDMDFLVKKANRKIRESLWYEKYFLLFFAPIVAYYAIIGRARPIYSTENRCFHNLKSLIIYGIFLFILGYIFWDENIKAIMLVIFGIMGFAFHLIVDGIILSEKFIEKKIKSKRTEEEKKEKTNHS